MLARAGTQLRLDLRAEAGRLPPPRLHTPGLRATSRRGWDMTHRCPIPTDLAPQGDLQVDGELLALADDGRLASSAPFRCCGPTGISVTHTHYTEHRSISKRSTWSRTKPAVRRGPATSSRRWRGWGKHYRIGKPGLTLASLPKTFLGGVTDRFTASFFERSHKGSELVGVRRRV
jgi:hypothetical protein